MPEDKHAHISKLSSVWMLWANNWNCKWWQFLPSLLNWHVGELEATLTWFLPDVNLYCSQTEKSPLSEAVKRAELNAICVCEPAGLWGVRDKPTAVSWQERWHTTDTIYFPTDTHFVNGAILNRLFNASYTCWSVIKTLLKASYEHMTCRIWFLCRSTDNLKQFYLFIY